MNPKRIPLEWLAKHLYPKKSKVEKIVEEELKHHPTLQAIIDKGYVFEKGLRGTDPKDPHELAMFYKKEQGKVVGWVIYDHTTNKIMFEDTYGVIHKKPKIDYL